MSGKVAFVWQLLLEYAHEVEITNNVLFSNEGWDRLKRLESDILELKESEVKPIRDALNTELALKQAHGDGWRARIALGDLDTLDFVPDIEKWHRGASSNPHKYNSDLYREWQRGFMDNDYLRRYDQAIDELQKRRNGTFIAKGTEMPLTTDPNDPRLGHGVDEAPVPQHEVYLVLSEEERAKGFVRPYRDRYIHVGAPSPTCPLLDLTDEQKALFGDEYAKFESYPESELPATGKFWTQAELDHVGKGCGTETVMGQALSETYARQPGFYGSTYCTGCSKHLPVDEFVWSADETRVGS